MENGKMLSYLLGFIVLFLYPSTRLTFVSATFLFDNGRVDLSKCTLKPESERMKLELERKIEQNNRLIYLNITVQWNSYPANKSYPNKMLWFLTTGATGKHLLSLDDNFEGMSLGTLSYRITDSHISLVQEPADCLGKLTANDADKLLKFSLLNLPKTQKAVNEEEMNIIHICTGFAESGGSCCNLSLTSKGIKCQKLADNIWVDTFAKVIFILTLISMSHSIYLIPSFIYENAESNFYKLYKNDSKKLSVKIISEKPISDEWTYVKRNFPIIDRMCNELIPFNLVKRETFDLTVKWVQRKDIDLVSELGNFHSLCTPFEYIYLKCNLPKRKCLNVFCKISIILFCTSPIIFRTYLSFWIHSDIPPLVFLLLNASVILFVLGCTFLPGGLLPNHKEITESLRTFNRINYMTMTELIKIVSFNQLSFSIDGILLMVLSLVLISIILVLFSLPVCLFLVIFICVTLNGKIRQILPIFLYICGLLNYALCAVFYAKCIAYILIGLLLNYEQVIDTVLLILMVLIYVVDCLRNVHKKIEYFRQTVLNIMFELSDTPRETLFFDAMRRSATYTARSIKFLKEYGNDRIANVKFNVGADGPFLSVDGLYLFYKYNPSDCMPYLYIPHTFFEELTSRPGHTSHFRTYSLLLNACKEILFLFLAMLAVFFIIHGFTRNNDISAIVHTLVTFSSSAAMAKLNKLLFRSSEDSLNGKDLFLKEHIIRQCRQRKDISFNAEFEYSEILATDNRNESEYDILILKNYRGQFEACYLKPPPPPPPPPKKEELNEVICS